MQEHEKLLFPILSHLYVSSHHQTSLRAAILITTPTEVSELRSNRDVESPLMIYEWSLRSPLSGVNYELPLLHIPYSQGIAPENLARLSNVPVLGMSTHLQ